MKAKNRTVLSCSVTGRYWCYQSNNNGKNTGFKEPQSFCDDVNDIVRRGIGYIVGSPRRLAYMFCCSDDASRDLISKGYPISWFVVTSAALLAKSLHRRCLIKHRGAQAWLDGSAVDPPATTIRRTDVNKIEGTQALAACSRRTRLAFMCWILLLQRWCQQRHDGRTYFDAVVTRHWRGHWRANACSKRSYYGSSTFDFHINLYIP